MSDFDKAFDTLMGHEGRYWNDPVGGETMWGVTKHVAREWGYLGDMRELTIETAKAIARARYWTPNQCDQLPYALAYQVFDTAYNGGHVASWLQMAVGATPDGIIGARTIAAARAADVGKAVATFNHLRLMYLTSLKNWPENSRGWARRIAANLLLGAQ